MAQPTISRHVAALEQEIGEQLFLRTGRTLELTPAGKYMVEKAQDYLIQCARLATNCRLQMSDTDDGLRISAGPWESYLLAEPLRRFSLESDRSLFHVSTHSYPWLARKLMTDPTHLSFCLRQCLAGSDPALSVIPVFRKPWLVAASVTSPFWTLPGEKRAWLEGQTVIVAHPFMDSEGLDGTNRSPAFEPDCLRQGLRHAGLAHGGMLFTQLAMARAGYGVLIVPPWLPEYLLEGLRTEDCLAVPYAPTIVMVENPNLRHPQLPALKQLCLDHFQALGTLE